MPAKYYHALILTLGLTFACCLPVFASSPAGGQLYGNPWRMRSLGNLTLDGGNRHCDQVSFRFRAQKSGPVDSLACYWMPAVGKGYSAGTGGTIHVELQTDDGTANHLPSGLVLTSFSLPCDANLQATPVTANPAFDPRQGGSSFQQLPFDAPATLRAGSLYHLVFTNTDASPATNNYSIDCVCNFTPTSPMQPLYSDTDLAVLLHTRRASWNQDPYNYTPIYTLYNRGSVVQGQPYMQLDYPLGIKGYPIFATSHMVREKFVPSKTVTASRVSVLAYYFGSPGYLTVTVLDGSSKTVASGIIPSSAFKGSSMDNALWGTLAFTCPITLHQGGTYYLQLSAPHGTGTNNCYYTWSIQNGIPGYGLGGDGFPDGQQAGYGASYTTNGSIWITRVSDLMFYFFLGP